MKHLLITACAVGLSACASMPSGSYPSPGTGTQAETLWGRAVARYSDRQHAALEYAIKCDADLVPQIKPCDVVVDELAEIDDLGAAVQNDGEQALLRQDLPRLNAAIRDLDAVADELSYTMQRSSP